MGPAVRILSVLLVALVAFVGSATASAAPFRGRGKAATTEWKKGGTQAQARSRALRRARLDALAQALKTIDGPIDRSAKKAVTRGGEGWTGSYRILTEKLAGATVTVDVEVDIDVSRLAKRLTPRAASSASPLFRISTVDAVEGCGDAADDASSVLESMGVVSSKESAKPVTLKATCTVLGPVPNTYLQAASVKIEVGGGVARATAAGFGADGSGAIAQALGRALDEVAAELGAHRRGRIAVRIESPLPASRVRRLERAMRESVIGVTSTKVAGIDPDGAVRLDVEGSLSADALASKLEALSLPGFSLTIVGINAEDALTIRLH